MKLRPYLALVALVACSPDGDTGPPGPSLPGDPGDTGETGDPASPSISAVVPDLVLLGRTVDVTLSGFGTDWTADATVVFDTVNEAGEEDIVVEEIRRASPTSLVATIHVTEGAKLGLRDIRVVDGDETFTFSGIFNVAPPLQLLGTFAEAQPFQGAVTALFVAQRDPLTPFHPRFTRSWITGGAEFGVFLLDSYFAAAFVAIDVFAPPGPTDLHVDSGIPEGDPIQSVLPNALTVIERLPQVINTATATIPIMGSDSRLLAIDASAGQVVDIATSDGGVAGFGIAVLPPSGRHAETLDGGFKPLPEPPLGKQFFAPTDGRYYVTIRPFENFDYALTLEIDRAPKVPIALTPPQTIQRPILVGVAADVFSVQAEAGQRIRATVGPGTADSCGPVGNINADLFLVDADGAPHGFVEITSNNLCPDLSALVEETGTYYLRVTPTHRSLPQLVPGQWLCAPVDVAVCGFDYSLTVEVE